MGFRQARGISFHKVKYPEMKERNEIDTTIKHPSCLHSFEKDTIRARKLNEQNNLAKETEGK